MAGRVDQVDDVGRAITLVKKAYVGGFDGHLSLLLLLHVIEG